MLSGPFPERPSERKLLPVRPHGLVGRMGRRFALPPSSFVISVTFGVLYNSYYICDGPLGPYIEVFGFILTGNLENSIKEGLAKHSAPVGYIPQTIYAICVGYCLFPLLVLQNLPVDKLIAPHFFLYIIG